MYIYQIIFVLFYQLSAKKWFGKIITCYIIDDEYLITFFENERIYVSHVNVFTNLITQIKIHRIEQFKHNTQSDL